MEISRTQFKSGPNIGIVGGGQLAKMIALAGLKLGCCIQILERKNHAPASDLASQSLSGDWNKPEELLKLAAVSDVITLENEFIDAGSLAVLEQEGHLVYPGAHSISLVGDKFIQRQTLAEAELPVPDFRPVNEYRDIRVIAAELGWPLVIKTRRYGYDGKGTATVKNAEEIDAAWEKLNGDGCALYAEAFCPFVKELAMVITTGRDKQIAAYPLVESIQKDHICHTVHAPAAVSEAVRKNAADIAKRAVAAVGAVGSFGVEMFLTEDERVVINELAPRVHNSGHYTIEACECSQFENHVRAVLGWPLGSTSMVKPAAIMINLLGQGNGSGYPQGLDEALRLPGVHIHNYGKEMSSKGRKMGHITVVGDDLHQIEPLAKQAASMIRFGAAE